MRIKLSVLTALCLLLFACYTGDDDNVITTVNLTPTNYVYEGDIYRFFLTSEIESLINQIEIWEAIGPNDEGFNEAQENIAAAENTINLNNELLESTITGVQIGLPPIPPPPPPPCFCFDDLYNLMDYIVVDNSTIGLIATLTDENQESVFSTDLSGSMEIEDFQDSLVAYNFNKLQDNFTGKGFLTINRVLADETAVSYTVEVFVNGIDQ